MISPIKSPHELLMEQAGLPHFAEGRSVSPEQMKVELMINGRPVHTEHLAHDHPLVQHFAGGSAVAPVPAPSFLQNLSSFAGHIPKALLHGLNMGLPAYDVYDKLKQKDYAGAKESAVEAATGFLPIPAQLAITSTDLNSGEDEMLKKLQARDDMLRKQELHRFITPSIQPR